MGNLITRYLKRALLWILNRPDEYDKVVATGFSRGLHNVTFLGKNRVPDRCNFSGDITIGYATTLGYNNFLHGNIIIGNYCQFGADVALHSTNHPTKYLTTYINSTLFDGELKKLKETGSIEVGSDVWIGHNAIIVGKVKIGNGAVVAAGSVVTKDVPPFAIVAGVPAKVVRSRFSHEVIEQIEALKWWDMDEIELQRLRPLFFKPLTDSSQFDNYLD